MSSSRIRMDFGQQRALWALRVLKPNMVPASSSTQGRSSPHPIRPGAAVQQLTS